jgi:hypothetical protein
METLTNYRKIYELQRDGFERVNRILYRDVLIDGRLDNIVAFTKSGMKYHIDHNLLEDAIKELYENKNLEKLRNLFSKGDIIALCFDKSEDVWLACQFK